MVRIHWILALFAALSVAAPTAAHHSTAMFDQTKDVVLTGTVREFQWTNPHSWIQLRAEKVGTYPAREWSIELASPNTMSRFGWKKSTLLPGQKVAMVINPMRDGTAAGSLVSLTLADGTVMTVSGRPPAANRVAPKPR